MCKGEIFFLIHDHLKVCKKVVDVVMRFAMCLCSREEVVPSRVEEDLTNSVTGASVL